MLFAEQHSHLTLLSLACMAEMPVSRAEEQESHVAFDLPHIIKKDMHF
jgi:hypothetical protein